ncbi:MAG: hypothetical protein AAF578_15655 [Pseudomonadota bacterium]
MEKIRALPLLLFVIGALSLGQATWWAMFEEEARTVHAIAGFIVGILSTVSAAVLLAIQNDKGTG